MKSLIEVALHKANREAGLEGFDFTKSAAGNNFPYVSRKPVMGNPLENLPIKAEKSDWTTIETSNGSEMHKNYKFRLIEHLLFFIEEVIKLSDKMNHHPKIEIKEKDVYVTLSTHEIQDISSLDLKLAKFCDELFEDVYYIEEFE